MKTINWSRASIVDLTAIRHWLVTEASEPVARRLLTQIRTQASQLASFPSIGSAIGQSERKLRVRGTSYVIAYRTSSERVEVLRVHHNRQDWRP